jgi:hypothetical protein
MDNLPSDVELEYLTTITWVPGPVRKKLRILWNILTMSVVWQVDSVVEEFTLWLDLVNCLNNPDLLPLLTEILYTA